MNKIYYYVGPDAIRRRCLEADSNQFLAENSTSLINWLRRQIPRGLSEEAFTFVIDAEGRLRLADRRSEHVAAAMGEPVLSAGEMTLLIQGNDVVVSAVTNQSTGYCPESTSWRSVRNALDLLGLEHPDEFARKYDFRRCPSCGQINIVKDGILECAVCESALPSEWNFTG